MAGIYLHIPYCKYRCIYCDFYKETDESSMNAFVNAVCREAEVRKDELRETVHTVYFGGGTPSRMNKTHFEQIFEVLLSNFSIAADAEITLEANPDDLTSEYIEMLTGLPVNRLSIGIQSFNDKTLSFMSRRHTARQAIDAVKNAQEAGFDNISIDLMYGLPKQTMEIWESDLKTAFELNVQHISAYHLIYEPDTKLFDMLQRGRVKPIPDDLSVEMFFVLVDRMAENGFEYYETSNFARNGLYSRHNTSYWQSKPYLGLGPSAHSYNGEKRSWNIASIDKYIRSIEKGQLNQESETLSFLQKYDEYIITRIRTKWGIDLDFLKEKFGSELQDHCLKAAQKQIENGFLFIDDNHLKLTRKGLFMADGIAVELMADL